MDKNKTKEVIISSAYTFVAGFAMGILPVIDQLTVESVETGAYIGVIFIGLRTGLKLTLEALVTAYRKIKG